MSSNSVLGGPEDANGPDVAQSPAPVTSAPPPENPPFGGMDVIQIGLLTFVVPVILAPFVVLVVQKLFYPALTFNDVAQKPWVLLGPQFVWFAAVALFLVDYSKARFHQTLWQAVSWKWPREGWPALIAIGIGTLALQILQRVLPMPQTSPFDKFFQRPIDGFAMAVLGIVFAPFMEELFFRGFLYPVVARKWGVAAGVLGTAAVFGLIHYPEYKSWGPVLIIFLVGVILALVRAQRHSVAASFVVHGIYNGVPILVLMIASHGFHNLPKLAH
ncbi:MAG TPA: type II CAAX endopeptidase family protein [Terriglobales bacterium]|nr:type II CAAX endopeptidase family protein [Terriglobales bacterium]